MLTPSLLGDISLKAGWGTVWAAVQGAVGTQLTTLMTGVGVILVVGSALKWLWERRRSGMQGGHSNLVWTTAFGMVLAGPNILIPVLLGLIDTVANIVIHLLGQGGA